MAGTGTKHTEYGKIMDILLLILLAGLTLQQIFRAPYGLDRCDECFYLTVPYRFLQGDIPIIDEWNASQLSGLLLTPILWVYRLLGGTGEGIILSFRYIYVGFQTLTASAIYLLLRRKSPLGALCAAAVFVPFSPLYIMALSYNSMGIGLMILSGLTLSCKEHSAAFRFMSGALFAGAVLCCPFLLGLYGLAGILAVIVRIAGGNREVLRGFALFTAGAALIALAVAAAILPRAGIRAVLSSLPNILNDPEHGSLSFGQQTALFFRHLLFSRKISLVSSVAAIVLSVSALLDRERAAHRWLYVTAAGFVTAGFIACNCLQYSYINFFMLPLCILGMVCYITDERKERAVFRYVYLAGWVYAYLMILSSNNFYESLTGSLTVSSVASAFFAGRMAEQFFRSGRGAKRLIAAGTSLTCVILLCVVLLVNKNTWARGTYMDFSTIPTDLLNYTIEDGPAKGIRTYDNDYVKYRTVYEQAESARNAEGKNVLYLSYNCFLYLSDEKRSSAFSAWLFLDYPQSTLDRLREYFLLHPEKSPDVFYIERFHGEEQMFTSLIDLRQFELTATDTAYIYTKKPLQP